MKTVDIIYWGHSTHELFCSKQYSCLENSMDRGVWWAITHGVTKSWTNTLGTDVKTKITGKDPDARKDWKAKELELWGSWGLDD